MAMHKHKHNALISDSVCAPATDGINGDEEKGEIFTGLGMSLDRSALAWLVCVLLLLLARMPYWHSAGSRSIDRLPFLII
jgi:hypothetical protein